MLADVGAVKSVVCDRGQTRCVVKSRIIVETLIALVLFRYVVDFSLVRVGAVRRLEGECCHIARKDASIALVSFLEN